MKPFIVALALLFAFSLRAQETIITGTLLGYDGKPMQMTNIHLQKPGQKPKETVRAEKDGSFKLIVKDTGIVLIKFAGLFHLSEDIPFLIKQPSTIKLSLQLGTYHCNKKPLDPKILGSFNNWNLSKPFDLKEEKDGTYSAEFETAEKEFSYQVQGFESTGRTVNGTLSERYEYDGDGDYRSIVTPKDGKIKIVFDPSKVLVSSALPKLQFDDPGSRAARYSTYRFDVLRLIRERSWALLDFINSGGESKDFKFDKDYSSEMTACAQEIKKESDPLLRDLLFLKYFYYPPEKGDIEIARLYLKVLPDLMKHQPSAGEISVFSSLLSIGKMMQYNDEYMSSFFEIIDNSKSAILNYNLINNVMRNLKTQNDAAAVKAFYTKALEKLEGTSWLRSFKQQYAPKAVIAAGEAVPSFLVKSLEDNTKIYTNQTMKGKVYLVHFWASWSEPSLKEMENLHKTYEQYKTKNFEILSLSVDASPEEGTAFRKKKWAMPWLHAFASTEKNLLADFGVLAPPKLILIDTKGIVVAMDAELQGAALGQTLARILK
ncbi:MAG: TlpA disulfide reductase family protein [bacterium]